MGGFFGVVSKTDCVTDLYYGTDYHCHLGTRRGGLAVAKDGNIQRYIHDISNSQFRSKFNDDVKKMAGPCGIGVISDYEDQPLIIGSHLGTYAIVMVGVIKNAEELVKRALSKGAHFSEMSGVEVNATEIIATLINEQKTFEDGIQYALQAVEGSCSILILTGNTIYAGRDKLGRTPVILGKKDDGWAVTFESCAFPNLGYDLVRDIGPGEVVRITAEGEEQLKKPGEKLQICAFLWVYYGYPGSTYEGIGVEGCRYKCGAALANRDNVKPDCVAGIPDSGVAHAIGYANEAKVPYGRPFAKYTPTWPRSFMPTEQGTRDLVARMKLLPVPELIKGKNILFCDDSIVRGTQLQDTVRRLYDAGAAEIHMRPACPPLVYGCKFLQFSRSRSIMDLAARKAIKELEGREDLHLEEYCNPDSEKYAAMVERIRKRLELTTLQFQRLDDLVEAIGLPKEKLCTYCWDGAEEDKGFL
ncbi:MAG: amidophosphoribosyltransferase [Fibrobacteres bacterium]|nr:amidophosphoribosyltransferase [Fibrobacterota bacterium]